jgi:SpoU rRNA methylase family enzyme
LNNLFKKYKYQPTTNIQEKVGKCLDGVVRVVAAAAQSGVGSIQKCHLSYEKVMIWFLQEHSHEGIFA